MPSLSTDNIAQTVEGLITASGAGTYTLTLPIPVGAEVRDVLTSNDVLWDSAVSATLKVGDADADDGYFTGVDAKASPAADTTAGGGLSSFLSGTGSGTYAGFTKRYPTGGNIIAVLTAVGAGSAGRTRVRAEYVLPTTILAAVKS